MSNLERSNWEQLVKTVGLGIVEKGITFIGKDVWESISAEGKEDVQAIGLLMAEVGLLEASGVDGSEVRSVLLAALGNWEVAGQKELSNEFLSLLKEGLLMGARVGLKLVVGI